MNENDANYFKLGIDAAMDEVAEWCRDKGWWNDGRTFGDDIALIHSELSEALEAFRDHGMEDATTHVHDHLTDCRETGICKPEGVGSELADVLVRLFHVCAERNIDLASEFIRKMQYNRTRAYRHGGKAL